MRMRTRRISRSTPVGGTPVLDGSNLPCNGVYPYASPLWPTQRVGLLSLVPGPRGGYTTWAQPVCCTCGAWIDPNMNNSHLPRGAASLFLGRFIPGSGPKVVPCGLIHAVKAEFSSG